MSYTSKYAQEAMDKAMKGDEPKAKGKTVDISKKKKLIQDPKYMANLKKKKAEELKNMTPNNPKY